jgi:hypothetical protein
MAPKIEIPKSFELAPIATPNLMRMVGKKRTRSNLPPGSRGSRKGIGNLVPRDLKNSILAAAEALGFDGAGLHGVDGYLQHIARFYPKTFCYLLGKVLPLTVNATDTRQSLTRVEIISVPSGARVDADGEVRMRETPDQALQFEPTPPEAFDELMIEPIDKLQQTETVEPAIEAEPDVITQARARGYVPLPPRARRIG